MGPSFNTHLPRSPSLLAASNGALRSSTPSNPLKRTRSDDNSAAPLPPNGVDLGPGPTRQHSLLHDLYARSERMISSLFSNNQVTEQAEKSNDSSTQALDDSTAHRDAIPKSAPKRPAREIDEDDYGDDEDDDRDELLPDTPTPINYKRRALSKHFAPDIPAAQTADEPQPPQQNAATSSDRSASSEEVRKKLEQEKKAAEDAAKESFQNLFYTLENDRDAMLEQQKLDELDRQVETEMSGQGSANNNAGGTSGGASQQGTLSSANLGASSLTLKHLIARIDQKRHLVKATDAQLRSLMSEVRKNRSKWASEDKIGQEELYESAERVLMELKAMTEWAGPFLQKVNKRDAPDYYHIIKHPMDIGTMIKKLKQLQYNSKKQFCEDLDLIWTNCLKYNANPEHFLRKKAEHMRKETARLIPLIPDIVVRDRAEVEAEERRLQHDFDDGEDSEDEPLMSTRGRKAPGKSTKKGTSTARKAVTVEDDSNPSSALDGKPANPSLNTLSNLKLELLRSDAESQEDSQHGLSTPPPGNLTPFLGSAAPPSQVDASELDGIEQPPSGVASVPIEEPYQEDEEYQTWKQVTKKDRARVAAERHRLFQTYRINPEEPALLRTRAAMRRYLRQQKTKDDQQALTRDDTTADDIPPEENDRGTTLAEGMDVEDDSVLPDYYDPLGGVPQIDERLAWNEDGEGEVIEQKGECLRLVPEGQFISPHSAFGSKIDQNLRQMQETRKITAKIGVVKQMQVQAQTYQNQFQKYEPRPFVEADVGPLVVSDDGPIMSQWACRQALQRSIAKIFYHAGFEECQPSALETITDFTADYFIQMVQTLKIYTETPKVNSEEGAEVSSPTKAPPPPSQANESLPLKPRFSPEEALLHTLYHFSHDMDSLETYVTDDIDRLSSRLESHHSKTKDYLAELLRPALDPAMAGADGAGAFNDGSEQFVGGDFAEDIDEDFFGFKELGLDKEFGLASLGVPLHLLQSRMHNAYQPTSVASASSTGQTMVEPPRYPAVTVENIENQIGLVKDFFKKKLEANDDEPLVEDDDLPVKQRFPKPRLPPTGKISSPRKRPLREQQMMARKKRRMEIEAEREREREAANATSGAGGSTKPDSVAPTSQPAASARGTQDAPAQSGGTGDAPTTNGEASAKDRAADVATVNGESGAPKDAEPATAAIVNGEVQVNGDIADVITETQPDATSGLKIDLDPPKQLQPTPAANGIKTGDPEKKKTPQPPKTQVNGEVEHESSENHEEQLAPGKDKKDPAAANDDSGVAPAKPDADDKKDADGDADGDAEGDAEGDADQDADHRDQNGMLSPESMPIAAH